MRVSLRERSAFVSEYSKTVAREVSETQKSGEHFVFLVRRCFVYDNLLLDFCVCRGELLSLRDIEHLHKKPKSDKETRLATAMVRNLAISYHLLDFLKGCGFYLF